MFQVSLLQLLRLWNYDLMAMYKSIIIIIVIIIIENVFNKTHCYVPSVFIAVNIRWQNHDHKTTRNNCIQQKTLRTFPRMDDVQTIADIWCTLVPRGQNYNWTQIRSSNYHCTTSNFIFVGRTFSSSEFLACLPGTFSGQLQTLQSPNGNKIYKTVATFGYLHSWDTYMATSKAQLPAVTENRAPQQLAIVVFESVCKIMHIRITNYNTVYLTQTDEELKIRWLSTLHRQMKNWRSDALPLWGRE